MNFKSITAAVVLAIAATTAQATTVGTGVGVSGFSTTAGNSIILAPTAGDWGSSSIATWIKASNEAYNTVTSIYYTFDLTGLDLTSVAISGHLWYDDLVTVLLNGTQVFSDQQQKGSNWQTGVSGSTSGYDISSLLTAGENVLTFNYVNTGGNGGIQAEISIDGTPSAVPLPAALPLLGAALGGLGLVRRRAKRTAAARA